MNKYLSTTEASNKRKAEETFDVEEVPNPAPPKKPRVTKKIKQLTKIGQWLQAGLQATPTKKQEFRAEDWEILHHQFIGEKWNLLIKRNIPDDAWFIDIRKYEAGNEHNRGAFIPVRLYPKLISALSAVPEKLEEKNFNFE